MAAAPAFDDDALKARVEAVNAALERSAADTEAVVSELDALHVACGAATADARALIRELTAQLEARGIATAGGADGAVDAADAEEIAALEAELAELEAEKAALAADGDGGALVAGEDAAELERAQHAASLYANITRVTWAPDCGDGVIAGVVAYDDGHTARRFSIDAAKGDFAVAQELWALLDRPQTLGGGAY